jgi:Ni,Fe-hydrogenase III large subunit/Ni,Fe-hydrogenase III component G
MLTANKALAKIKSKFFKHIIHSEEKLPGQLFLTIQKNILTKMADYLFNDLGARLVVNLGTDEIQLNGHLTVSHIFSLDKEKLFITVKVLIDPEDPFIDSITPFIPGANWTERETRDMLGVHLNNHPDPRRLILADDWPDSVYPLRKDFSFDTKPPSAPQNKVKMASPPPGAKTVPIGPFFPVLEEPAYFKVFAKGEKIVGCDYRGFYSHRGIEKLGDSVLTYNQIPFVAERICGICGFTHSACYCQAVEDAAGIEVPDRAKAIRTVLLELERIHSHLLWLGIAGHIIGFDTVLMQTWRIREPVMWICEVVTGNRKTYGMNLIGGVRRDIHADQYPKIKEAINGIDKELRSLINAVFKDSSLHARLKNVGILTKEEARKSCAVGPTARGSGVAIDSRVDHPYAAYDKYSFDIAVHPEGDCWARTLVRLEEVLEAVKIIDQAIDNLPEGGIMAEFDDIPPNKEGICSVEAPRGEATHYILTGDDNKPYRWRVRAPTYPNLQTMTAILQNEQIADVPITIGSLDPCFSCTERMLVVGEDKSETSLNTQDLLRLSREKTEKIRRLS